MTTLEDYKCSIPEAQMLGGNLTDMSKALRKEYGQKPPSQPQDQEGAAGAIISDGDGNFQRPNPS